MKKFIFLISILAALLLAVACGNEAVTTSPNTTNPPDATNPSNTTTPTTTAEAIFRTDSIKSITLYGQYGGGEGEKVDDEYLPELTAWLKSFAIDKEADNPLPPGTNTYYLEIEYSDGTVVKKGLDAVEVAGRLYYVKHAEEPEWLQTILPEPFVTTKSMPLVYPDSYTAELGCVQSCCGGVITDVSEKYDLLTPVLQMYFSEELPEYFGDHSLNADSSEAERIAVLKTMLETFAEARIDWDHYSLSIETEARVSGIPKTYDRFVAAKECAEGAEVNYTFVFTRTVCGYPTQAYYKVITEANGAVWFLSAVSAVKLDRFAEVEIDREALDAVVRKLGGENVTVGATLRTSSKKLYLVVTAEKELGDGAVHVEAVASTYYILLATLPDKQ